MILPFPTCTHDRFCSTPLANVTVATLRTTRISQRLTTSYADSPPQTLGKTTLRGQRRSSSKTKTKTTNLRSSGTLDRSLLVCSKPGNRWAVKSELPSSMLTRTATRFKLSSALFTPDLDHSPNLTRLQRSLGLEALCSIRTSMATILSWLTDIFVFVHLSQTSLPALLCL